MRFCAKTITMMGFIYEFHHKYASYGTYVWKTPLENVLCPNIIFRHLVHLSLFSVVGDVDYKP